MSSLPIDVFSLTNPAYVALILRSFCFGFVDGALTPQASRGAPYSFLYLVAPITLSADISATFAATNVRTGFIRWLSTNQETLVGFAERARGCRDITREALLFGTTSGLLTFGADADVYPSSDGLKRAPPRWRTSDERGRSHANAERLGRWLRVVQSESTVFSALGIEP